MAAANPIQRGHHRRRRVGVMHPATARAAALLALLCIIAGAFAAPAPAPAPPPKPKAPAPPPRSSASSSSATPPGELPPVYGNYCGYQNSSCEDSSFRKAPVDALDAACKRHDQCWCKNGRMDCGCDKALLESARELIRSSSSNATRTALPASTAAMATAVTAYFTVAPCVCRERKFCLPSCGARAGCTWGGPNCRQAVSPGLGGVCALKKRR